jgi:hypothetical protein
VLPVGADLQLDLGEAVRDGLAGQPHQLLVGVAEPAGGGGVGGVAVALQDLDPLLAADPAGLEDGQRLLPGERVLQVAEVDEFDDLLGRHVGEQPPHRLPGDLGGEVPGRVHHGPDRHVDDALLRPEPPKLTVHHQVGAERAQVADHLVGRSADHIGTQRLDRGDDHIVAAPDREAQAVALQSRQVGAQDHVRGRVVRVRVHRVRAVVLQRRREADVMALQRHDAHGRSRGHRRGVRSDLRHRGAPHHVDLSKHPLLHRSDV